MSRKTTKPLPDFVVTADVYDDVPVHIFRHAETFKQWLADRDVPWDKPNSALACVTLVTDQDGDEWFVAYIPRASSAETVWHECLHLAWDILNAYGVKVDAKNHEALAYLQQHLARQILRKR